MSAARRLEPRCQRMLGQCFCGSPAARATPPTAAGQRRAEAAGPAAGVLLLPLHEGVHRHLSPRGEPGSPRVPRAGLTRRALAAACHCGGLLPAHPARPSARQDHPLAHPGHLLSPWPHPVLAELDSDEVGPWKRERGGPE